MPRGIHVWDTTLYVIICLAPGQCTPSPFILIHIIETILACAALMLRCLTKLRFSPVSICQECLWKKCVIAALTTRWHSALRQIPWGPSIPQRIPFPSEKTGGKHGEGEALANRWKRDMAGERERETETCAHLCSSVFCKVFFECVNTKLPLFPHSRGLTKYLEGPPYPLCSCFGGFA